MWKVSDTVVVEDLDRALRALIATPDRRGPAREGLDGVAELTCVGTGRRARGVTIDLGEGGLSVLCAIPLELGASVRIEVAGLVFEGRVRHATPAGDVWRVGIESA